MADHHPSIRSLILLGGESSRMGSPKYLLPMPSAMSETGCEAPLLINLLCLHHIFQVKYGDPILRTVTLSVRDDAQRDNVKAIVAQYAGDLPGDLNISYVQDKHLDRGPSAGLVAAWRLDKFAHWIVTGCNHPLISKATLETLRTRHHLAHTAVTCYVNSDGDCQPLLALWTGSALKRLQAMVEQQNDFDPSHFLALLEQEEETKAVEDQTSERYLRGIYKVQATDKLWTTNVDSQDEWKKVEQYLEETFGHNDA